MKRYFTLLLFPLLLFSACQKTGEKPVTVTGKITGAKGETLLLEYLDIDGYTLEDSLSLSEEGTFTLQGDATEYPDFFRLRIGNEAIPFSADSLDRITVTADNSTPGNFSYNYKIEGGRDNETIKEIWKLYGETSAEISKLMGEYTRGKLSIFDLTRLKEEKLEMYREEVGKRIYSDPSSPAAYFGLMQQIGGTYIFDPASPDASRLYATVANVRQASDSLSPRTKQLYDLALRSIATVRMMRRQATEQADTTAMGREIIPELVGFIDLNLRDKEGKVQKLSHVAAQKVTLVSFTDMSADWAPEYGGLLRTLYGKYHDRGLEIYQVNIGSDRHAWLNGISGQPWTNVFVTPEDLPMVVGNYGLRSLPALFLINKGGEIILRASSVEELESSIASELAR